MASLSVANAASLNLTWSDNSENEDGFEIERSELAGEFSVLASVPADENSYTDSSVTPGVDYQYRVRAYNAFGYSGYTNVSQGSVENTPPEIGVIGDVAFPAGDPVAEISIAVADAETSVENLVFEVISSNASVLPNEGIETLVQDGALKLQFATTGDLGTSNLTILVSDGADIAQTSFGFELLENNAPTISSTQRLKVYNSQKVGPISLSVNDTESDLDKLVVTAVSLNEELVKSDSIRIEGTGSSRKVYFSTLEATGGQGTIRVTVSDGVNSANGAIPFEIEYNQAPTIAGFDGFYTLPSGGELSGVAFEVDDLETAANLLEVKVRSSNAALVGLGGIRVTGTGATRQLEISPSFGVDGVTEITVSVFDGARTTTETFEVRVLAPEEIVEILDFRVDEGLAVIEVANRPQATFTLWKIHSRNGAWELVSDAELMIDSGSTVIIDPTPISGSVCYRVVADQ